MLGHTRTWQLNNGQHENDLWRSVWSIDGPPKLKHFVWRACKGSLAVKERLCYRHITADNLCQICRKVETILHSLEGEHAASIWQYSKFAGFISGGPSSSFADFLLWLVGKLTKPELCKFLALAWVAWHCRNKAIFKATPPPSIHVPTGFCKMVEDYITYNNNVCKKTSALSPLSSATWGKPPSGLAKVNADTYISANNGVGLGVIVRGSDGRLIGAAAMRLGVSWDA